MKDAPRSIPAVRDHVLLALFALAVLALALFQDNYGVWCLLPVVPGLLSVLLYSAVGPVFVLGMLTFLLVVGNGLRGNPRWQPPPDTTLTDIVLALTCLVYVAAHWRLLSLVKQAVPGDPRSSRRPERRRLEGRWLLPAEDATRTGRRVQRQELLVLVLQAVLFALAGFLLSVRLRFESAPDVARMPDVLWRLLLVAWAVLLALMAGQALYAGLRWMLAGRDESLMYLQDQVWAATRGEQRRIEAWVTRARLDRQRKED